MKQAKTEEQKWAALGAELHTMIAESSGRDALDFCHCDQDAVRTAAERCNVILKDTDVHKYKTIYLSKLFELAGETPPEAVVNDANKKGRYPLAIGEYDRLLQKAERRFQLN